jgi:hypothetical protein
VVTLKKAEYRLVTYKGPSGIVGEALVKGDRRKARKVARAIDKNKQQVTHINFIKYLEE